MAAWPPQSRPKDLPVYDDYDRTSRYMFWESVGETVEHSDGQMHDVVTPTELSARPTLSTTKVDPAKIGLFDLPLELRRGIYSVICHDGRLGRVLSPHYYRGLTAAPESYEHWMYIIRRLSYVDAQCSKSLHMIHPKFELELLGTWAEETVHRVPLLNTFWQSRDHHARLYYVDLRWYRYLINEEQLAGSIYMQLRRFLQALEEHYKVARSVRHVRLTGVFKAHKDEKPAALLRRYNVSKVARAMERLDSPLGQPNLQLELELVCQHENDKMPDQTIWTRARRTMGFSLNPRNVTVRKAGRKAETDWMCAKDGLEIREVHRNGCADNVANWVAVDVAEVSDAH
ncbi:hypothetical protein LTR15_005245 [Elasticomyces elasticus]|nr:hypothetical protein LTR15_005245 [Elasticomyces elasticus]